MSVVYVVFLFKKVYLFLKDFLYILGDFNFSCIGLEEINIIIVI